MSLFLCKRRISKANSFPMRYSNRGAGYFEPGDVVREVPTFGLGAGPEHWEQLPDPCDDARPATVAEVGSGCNNLLGWIRTGHLPDPVGIVQERLCVLVDAYAMLPDSPPLTFNAGDVRAAQTLPNLVTLAKRLQHWAGEQPTALQPSETAKQLPTDTDAAEAETKLCRPAKELLKPDSWPATYKQLKATLDAHPEIRRRQPLSKKTGRPIPNRLLVHLGDWLAYLEKREREATGQDPLDLPGEIVDRAVQEVARRKAEIDRGRAAE